MADYYDNSDQAQRFQPGTTVRADEVDAKFDSVASGFSSVGADVERALKLTSDGTDHVIDANAQQRRQKYLGFDRNGGFTLRDGFTWKGDWSSGTLYLVNDIIRDPATSDIYVVEEAHTAGTSLDTTKMSEFVNVSSIESAKTDAEQASADALTYRDEAQAAAEPYQGALSADPAARSDGSALQAGDFYYNTTTNGVRVYSGSDWKAGAFVTDQGFVSLPSASSVTVDFSSGVNFDITLAESASLSFSGTVPGRAGVIVIRQDASGGHDFTLPAEAKTPVGGASIIQTTAPETVSTLSYFVVDSATVLVNYIGDFQ